MIKVTTETAQQPGFKAATIHTITFDSEAERVDAIHRLIKIINEAHASGGAGRKIVPHKPMPRGFVVRTIPDRDDPYSQGGDWWQARLERRTHR